MPFNREQEMIDAYRRLQSGAPTNPELKARLAAGRLAINAKTVCMEAGVSRTMVATRAPGYERICSLLYPQETVAPDVGSLPKKRSLKTSKEVISDLRVEKRQLEQQRAAFATLLAETSIALELSKKRIQSLEAEVIRVKSSGSPFEGAEWTTSRNR